MKYGTYSKITPAAVYQAQCDGYKFVRLSEEQIELAEKAHKELHTLEYETETKKVVCVGVYVKVLDLIKIAL